MLVPERCRRPWKVKTTRAINLGPALFMSHYRVSPSDAFPRLISSLLFLPSVLPELKHRPSPFVQPVLPSRTRLGVSATAEQTLDWRSVAAHTTVNPVDWTIFISRQSLLDVVRIHKSWSCVRGVCSNVLFSVVFFPAPSPSSSSGLSSQEVFQPCAASVTRTSIYF